MTMEDNYHYPERDEYTYNDNEEQEEQTMRMPALPRINSKEVIENYSDLMQWMTDPESKKMLDARHTKDIILANLDEREMAVFRDFLEFSRELQMYPCLGRAKFHFIATGMDIAITSNAKGGFTRRINHTTRSESQSTFERKEEPMSKTGGFWGRKK